MLTIGMRNDFVVHDPRFTALVPINAWVEKLYTGAIFLLQLSYYAGIYDDAAGCPLIHYSGAYRFRGFDAITHPDPERYFAAVATRDGNPT